MAANDTSIDARDWSLLGLLSALWGGSFFFNGVVLRELPPLTVVFLRVTLAALMLLPLLRLYKVRFPDSLSGWAPFIAIGLLNNVLPVAKEKYGSFDPEAIRKAALDVDIPPGGTIQGYGVKFFRPGTPLAGQNERSTPVVMQNAGEHISVVWPTNIRTQDPVFPLPKSSTYGA